MHDLECCVRYNGKTYCWDPVNDRIVEIVINDIEPSECPDLAMKIIMRHVKKKGDQNA